MSHNIHCPRCGRIFQKIHDKPVVPICEDKDLVEYEKYNVCSCGFTEYIGSHILPKKTNPCKYK